MFAFATNYFPHDRNIFLVIEVSFTRGFLVPKPQLFTTRVKSSVLNVTPVSGIPDFPCANNCEKANCGVVNVEKS